MKAADGGRDWQPEAIWVERGEETSAVARRVLTALPGVPVHLIEDPSLAEPSGFRDGKRRLVLQRHRGTFLQHCPAGTTGMVCCNYLVVNFASNCPYDCTYCFLQDYVANNPAIKIFTNVADGLDEIDTALAKHPDRQFRVGTGELADSLALDRISGLSLDLLPFFASRPNAVLELKTKSVCIENLLAQGATDRVVVSWSVNAPEIVAREDRGAAPLDERIAAAARLQAAGYRVGFHVDPLVAHDGWEEGYSELVRRIFARVDPVGVAWISLGSLRMTSRLKTAIRARQDRGEILTGELVPCADGKERVWRGLRVQMYRRMLDALRAVDSSLPLYICMEPANVWEKVMGSAPADRDVARDVLRRTADPTSVGMAAR